MSGALMIDLEGIYLTDEEKELLQHKHVGGVLLFTRNYKSIEQLKQLTSDIRKYAKKNLLITVDHEGGKVWRFKEGFTHIQAAAKFGEIYNQDPKLSIQQVINAAKIIASELLECGVDLTLAPVLDLQGINTAVIGDRAFHSDPNIVAELGKAFISGLAENGMASVGKHFPGHGGCNFDTHVENAIDKRSYAEISKTDLVPFKKLSKSLKGIMPAHVVYSEVDLSPAGFSKIWLQEILRKELNFEGAIISDCVSMKAAAVKGDFLDRIHVALNAGCDMVIVAQQKRKKLFEVLEKLNWNYTVEQLNRLKGLLYTFKVQL